MRLLFIHLSPKRQIDWKGRQPFMAVLAVAVGRIKEKEPIFKRQHHNWSFQSVNWWMFNRFLDFWTLGRNINELFFISGGGGMHHSLSYAHAEHKLQFLVKFLMRTLSITLGSLCLCLLKGTVSRNFLLLVLFMNPFPPSPRVFY